MCTRIIYICLCVCIYVYIILKHKMIDFSISNLFQTKFDNVSPMLFQVTLNYIKQAVINQVFQMCEGVCIYTYISTSKLDLEKLGCIKCSLRYTSKQKNIYLLL